MANLRIRPINRYAIRTFRAIVALVCKGSHPHAYADVGEQGLLFYAGDARRRRITAAPTRLTDADQ
jgi:hypothetical protein